MIEPTCFDRKKILVTGGAGFIGSNVARRLADCGAQVTVVDSLIPDYGGNPYNLAGYEDCIHLNVADVRDPYSMNHLVKEHEILFNLAGQVSHTDSMENPYTDLEINVRAQLSILEACRRNHPEIRIVFASTRQIYGKPAYLPVDENHPLCPVDVNGINKIASEKYHLLYHQVYGLPVSILRLTNVYGPRMRIKDARQTFVGWWIRQQLEGRPIQIYGDGLQVRDLNYIDDVVEALLLAAVTPGAQGEVFNLGAEPVTLLELARLFINIYGSGECRLVEFPPERKAIDIGSFRADYSKIQNLLGWQPTTSLAEGLRRTFDYYRNALPNYL